MREDSKRLAVAAVFFLICSTFAVRVIQEQRQESALLLLSRQFADESGAARAKPMSGADLTLLKSMAARQPTRQDLLYILSRDAEVRGDAQQSATYAKYMARLGWRNSAAQKSLLIRAVEARAFPELLNRADAMLRRNVLPDQAMQMIYLFEINPDVREPLVRALKRKPAWRQQFFARTDVLQNPVQRMARVSTIRDLLDHGDRVQRDEIAPLVNTLDLAGEKERAEDLWLRFTKAPKNSLSYDSAFQELAKLDANRPDLVMPFEWRTHQGIGYYSYVSSAGGLRIEWDGRGVPVLFTQRLRYAGKRPIKVSLETATSVVAASAALDASLVCGGNGGTVPLDRKDISAAKNLVSFSSVKAAGCAYPELRFTGALRDVASPADLTIRSIHVSTP